jgi:hypothetical protein
MVGVAKVVILIAGVERKMEKETEEDRFALMRD